jgi:hypothetical protein
MESLGRLLIVETDLVRLRQAAFVQHRYPSSF